MNEFITNKEQFYDSMGISLSEFYMNNYLSARSFIENTFNTIAEFFFSYLYLYFIYTRTFFINNYFSILRTYVNITQKIAVFYENNPAIYNFVNKLTYCCMFSYMSLLNRKIEPFESDWICVSILYDNSMKQQKNLLLLADTNKDKIGYLDTYIYTNEILRAFNSTDPFLLCTMFRYELLVKFYTIWTENIKLIFDYSRYCDEILLTMKYKNTYRTMSFFRSTYNIPPTIFFQVSPYSARFLSIKYNHPKMQTSIFLEVPNSMYYNHNHILSALFVKRLLVHQRFEYAFDMEYTLDIMDDDLNYINLVSSQFIILFKDHNTDKPYIIVDVPENNK